MPDLTSPGKQSEEEVSGKFEVYCLPSFPFQILIHSLELGNASWYYQTVSPGPCRTLWMMEMWQSNDIHFVPCDHPTGHPTRPVQTILGHGSQQEGEDWEEMRDHLGSVLGVDMRDWSSRGQRLTRAGASLQVGVRHREYPGLTDQAGIVIDWTGPDWGNSEQTELCY